MDMLISVSIEYMHFACLLVTQRNKTSDSRKEIKSQIVGHLFRLSHEKLLLYLCCCFHCGYVRVGGFRVCRFLYKNNIIIIFVSSLAIDLFKKRN